ncbi:MAG TPA: group 1 truncated hemoglobin [Polyangiaceae bacterium]|nr:group 1 truncated hemoglobin [Polyangiaceae bacterium]
MASPSLFDELGGEARLRPIIDRFIDRTFDDVMIGFFFRNASRERVKDKEYEFAARLLGAPVEYTGRPLANAHAPHPIMGGQFMRRLQILKETLSEFAVPDHIQRVWIEHTEQLMSVITRDRPDQCVQPVSGRDPEKSA